MLLYSKTRSLNQSIPIPYSRSTQTKQSLTQTQTTDAIVGQHPRRRKPLASDSLVEHQKDATLKPTKAQYTRCK
jgi:hypothetical protein